MPTIAVKAGLLTPPTGTVVLMLRPAQITCHSTAGLSSCLDIFKTPHGANKFTISISWSGCWELKLAAASKAS